MLQIVVDLDDARSVERALAELIAGTRDARTLRQDAQFPVQFGTRARTKFRPLTGKPIACNLASGHGETRTPSSGMVFFARATRTAKLRTQVAVYVAQIIAHNTAAAGPVWTDDETQLGEDAAEALAIADPMMVATYLAFLRSCDVDLEVHQSDAICRIVAAHGWTPDTVALLAARASDCSGQGGEYDLQFLLGRQPLPAALRAGFVEGVIDGCKALGVDAYWKYVRAKLVRVLGGELPEPAVHAAVARGDHAAALDACGDDDFTAGAIHAYYLGDTAAARACFERFVTAQSPSRGVRAAIAEWARTKLDRAERAAFLVIVNADDSTLSAEALCDQAHERYQADAYDDAIAIYDRAIARDPACWKAYEWKAHCLRKLEHHAGAIAILDDAIARSGDERLYFDLGCAYRDAGDHARALAAFERNARSGDRRGRSGLAHVHNRIGCNHLRAGELDAADQAFRASIKSSPTSAAWANLARIFFGRGKHDDALEAARRSLKLEATADGHNLIACVQLAHSQFDDARQSLERSLALDPELFPARVNLVCLHALAGDTNAALAALEDALERGYDDFDWIAREKDLDSIRQLPQFARLVEKYRDRKSQSANSAS